MEIALVFESFIKPGPTVKVALPVALGVTVTVPTPFLIVTVVFTVAYSLVMDTGRVNVGKLVFPNEN